MKVTFVATEDGEVVTLLSGEYDTLPDIFELFKNFLRANGFDPDSYDFSPSLFEGLDEDE